jgi:YD repeat-containing protein
MRGQLKYEGHFNEGGNILRSVAYFPVFQPSGVITPCYTITSINSGELYDEYTWRSARKVSDSSVETMYDPGNNTAISQTKAVYYGSVSHHQPTRQVAYASAGATLVTNTKYAFDFQVAACDALDNAITSYAANAHADSVNFQNTLNTCTPQSSTTPAIQNCRYIGIQQFRENMSNHRIQYIQTRRANFTDPSNQFDIAHATAKNAADVLLKPILSLQDEYNNAPVELSDWKNNNLRRASFIQYNSSVSPAGFADPGRTQLVSLQTPSAVFTNAAVSGNSIVKDSRYQDETNFVFSKGNPQQVTAHDGIPNSYVWDDKNTRPIAKVVNATVDQVAFSSFETDGNGGWAVPSTLRGNSGITGQQSYNLSNGACQRTGINASGTSIVTYWSRSGQYTVTGDIAHSQGKTVNGWTYYEHRVTGFATISVSGSGDIDELRIYPAGSLMTTYVYAPLTGMISECDVNNRITYYDYDGLGRLQVIKDQDGNIIKTIDYHYKGQ